MDNANNSKNGSGMNSSNAKIQRSVITFKHIMTRAVPSNSSTRLQIGVEQFFTTRLDRILNINK